MWRLIEFTVPQSGACPICPKSLQIHIRSSGLRQFLHKLYYVCFVPYISRFLGKVCTNFVPYIFGSYHLLLAATIIFTSTVTKCYKEDDGLDPSIVPSSKLICKDCQLPLSLTRKKIITTNLWKFGMFL